MHQSKLAFSRLALVATITAVLFFTSVQAVPSSQVAHAAGGATVIQDHGCIISPEASGLPFPLLTKEKTHSVVTPSGNTLLSCHFDIPPGYRPAETMRHSGFLCDTFAGVTTNSTAVTTKGGKVHLTCQINGRVE
jgi:hypothetical protein